MDGYGAGAQAWAGTMGGQSMAVKAQQSHSCLNWPFSACLGVNLSVGIPTVIPQEKTARERFWRFGAVEIRPGRVLRASFRDVAVFDRAFSGL